MCEVEAGIKWPNDIVVNGKKICGILTEMSIEHDYVKYIVIGVGINVNMGELPEEIRESATSLFLESGREITRAELLQEVLQNFENNYNKFAQTYDLTGIINEYNEFLVNRGKEVRVLDPKGEFEGVAIGVNTVGELQVQTKDGKVTNVYAGEVSVRGLYGYV